MSRESKAGPKKDIFISYREADGTDFAVRLSEDLKRFGYSVYFNPEEKRSGSFPDQIREAIRECKDFLLILSRACLDRLMQDGEVDWVRTELLTAWEYHKNIIPILVDDVKMPPVSGDIPESIGFLPTLKALSFSRQYMNSPFNELEKAVVSSPDGIFLYRDAFNSNPDYDIAQDYGALLRKAEEGDVGAMYELGMMGFYGAASDGGSSSEWDYESAVTWLRKAAESDSDLRFHAECTLGRMYYQGLVPREQQSYEKSFMHHERAAAGDDFSARECEFLRRSGAGCKFDFRQIMERSREAIRNGDDEAIRAVASFLSRYGKYQEALDLYQTISVMSPETEYQIGMLYARGVHTDPPKPDYMQAAYYLRNAADQNHIQAAKEYGLMCMRPTGRFRKNFREAEKYLKLAANGGNAEAQYLLGYMYRTGLAPRNLPEAVRWFELSRKQNYPHAALELASLYQQPECQNYGLAYTCAEQSADYGSAEGMLILGNLLFWGRGCAADMDKAYEMYQQAYDHGYYYAKVMMDKIRHIRGLD